jgi:hypothetical protein
MKANKDMSREIQVTCKPPRKKKTGANATQYNEIRMCTCICRRRCHQQKYARGLLKSAGKHTCDHGTESMGIAHTLAEKNLGFLSEQAPRVWRIVVQDSSVINWKFAQKNQNTYEIGCRSSRTSSVYERRAKVQLMLVKLGGLTSNRNGCGCVKGDAPKEPSCFISML